MLVQLSPFSRLFEDSESNAQKNLFEAEASNNNTEKTVSQEAVYSILGAEKSGCFLVGKTIPSRDNKQICTIELVDTKLAPYSQECKKLTQSNQRVAYPQANRRTLCKFHLVQNTSCISASINADFTILSFTTMCKLNTLGSLCLYETFFVELTLPASQRILKPFKKGAGYKRIQFVHTMDKKTPYHFLYFSEKNNEKTTVELLKLNINPAHSRSGMIVISDVTSTTLLHTITENPLWCYLDYHRTVLYHISRKKLMPNVSGKQTKEDSSIAMECLEFVGDSTRVVARFTLPSVHFNGSLSGVSNTLPISYLPLEQLTLLPFDPAMDFQVVKLRNKVEVLCRQQPHPVQPHTDIIITIYMLSHQQTRKFTIHLDKQDAKMRKYRVIFAGVNDILIVFIPGVFLRLIDCGSHHADPCSFLTLQKPKDEGFLMDIPFLGKDMQQLVNTPNYAALAPVCINSKDRSFILNLSNGSIYECMFSKEHFVKWLEAQKDCKYHVQVLHWAIVHLQDEVFAEQIIRSLGNKAITSSQSDVLREYIIASVFVNMKKELREEIGNMHPFSSQESSKSKSLLETVRTSKIWQSFQFPPKIVEQEKNSSPKPSPSKSELSNDSDGEVVSRWRGLFNEGIKQMLTESNIQKKWLVKKFAAEFCDVVYKQVDQLYSVLKTMGHVTNTLFTDDRKPYFRLLEQFQCALEELGVPPPLDFHFTFATLGFQVLSRRMFTQYVNRDVFLITQSVIDFVHELAPFDSSMLFLLSRKLYSKQVQVLMPAQTPNSSTPQGWKSTPPIVLSSPLNSPNNYASYMHEQTREVKYTSYDPENTVPLIWFYHERVYGSNADNIAEEILEEMVTVEDVKTLSSPSPKSSPLVRTASFPSTSSPAFSLSRSSSLDATGSPSPSMSQPASENSSDPLPEDQLPQQPHPFFAPLVSYIVSVNIKQQQIARDIASSLSTSNNKGNNKSPNVAADSHKGIQLLEAETAFIREKAARILHPNVM